MTTSLADLSTDQLKARLARNEQIVSQYDNAQKAKKVQLNSLYGSLANAHFRFYDWRLASAITLSGQLSVQWVEKHLNMYFNKLLGTNDIDYIIAVDTDSCYVCLEPLLNQIGIEGKTTEQVVNLIDKLCKKQIQPVIDKFYEQLATNVNAMRNAMHMKREAIADKAIWKAKKRYIMNVWDSEGVRFAEPYLKMMGNEAIRSSSPAACKEAIKQAIKLIMDTDNDTVIKYIAEFRKKFYGLSFEEVAKPSGVNGIIEYADRATLFKKGTPIHVRASLVYNHHLRDKQLTNHPAIYDGDKIKYCYLRMPNPVRSNVIAAPRMLPKEFGLEPFIDYKLQFEKTFLEPIKSILDSIGWTTEKVNTLERFFE